MSVQFVVDREAKIVRTRFEGFVTYEDLRKHLIEEREQAGLALPEIIDARGITPVLSPLEVRSIVHLMTTLGQNVLGPTAIVIDSFMAFGVVRLAGILAESVGTIAPFWSEEDAEADCKGTNLGVKLFNNSLGGSYESRNDRISYDN